MVFSRDPLKINCAAEAERIAGFISNQAHANATEHMRRVPPSLS